MRAGQETSALPDFAGLGRWDRFKTLAFILCFMGQRLAAVAGRSRLLTPL
jgi:hypothetical protein